MKAEAQKGARQPPLVFVTGPAGAGRGTALNALEDLGFEAIDNMPLSMVPQLLAGRALTRPLVLGIDPRNRDFAVDAFADLLDSLRAEGVHPVELVYLDCAVPTLLRRFSETRRRHPMSGDDSPAEGIEREVGLLAPIRRQADVLIDTSDLSPHDLRATIGRWFGITGSAAMVVTLQSFAFKRGLPPDADMVFDCRFLRNPHWEPALRPLDGHDPRVAAHVSADPRFAEFFDRVQGLVELMLPACAEEGKAALNIAVGCTGGKHRSVMVVEKLSQALAARGWRVSKRHRELKRMARVSPV